MVAQARECDAEGVAVALFPELALTGYAIDDLLLQQVLLDEVEAALGRRRRGVRRTCGPVLVVGAPLRHGNRLFNCAVVVHAGGSSGWRPSPTYRTTGSSTSDGTSRPGTTSGGRGSG